MSHESFSVGFSTKFCSCTCGVDFKHSFCANTMQRFRQCYGDSKKKKFSRPPLVRSNAATTRAKSPLPRGTKFDYSNKRDLMNCIAYSPGNQRDARWMETWDDDSLSSDSSSDITDVSPASSLSDFGAPKIVLEPSTPTTVEISKETESFILHTTETLQVPQNPHNNTSPEKRPHVNSISSVKKPLQTIKKITSAASAFNYRPHPVGKQNKSPKEATKDVSDNEESSTCLSPITADNNEVSSLEQTDSGDLQLLVDALSELEGASQSQNQPSQPSRTKLNLSFTPEKARQIARENANLLGRLQRARTRGPQISSPPGPPEASAAINRRQKQRQIQHENMILLRKITSARATMSIRPRGGGVTRRPSSANMNHHALF